ncbi:MAG TPA: hypothetical protein DHU55_11005, partial [Blastocatellia bacterium]|nr:hypothetical protein [Blastocatellia bacterium]
MYHTDQELPGTGGAGAKPNGARVTRLRVRAVMSWRAKWLAAYAMGASQAMAARAAKVGHSTAEYHLKNDPDFAAQAEAAKAHAIDLLHARGDATMPRRGLRTCVLAGDRDRSRSQVRLPSHCRTTACPHARALRQGAQSESKELLCRAEAAQ